MEEVFEILEIKASLRGAATWALEQLTEPDFVLFDTGRSFFFGAPPSGNDKYMKEILAAMLPKGA